jgi:MarR family
MTSTVAAILASNVHASRAAPVTGAVALAPLGINGREAAVLRAIAPDRPVPQGEIARAMNVDRTTMVALIDDLQLKREFLGPLSAVEAAQFKATLRVLLEDTD